MNKFSIFVLTFISVFSLSNATLRFYSPVEIYKNNAVIKATFYYILLKAIRYDYTDPMEMTELYDLWRKSSTNTAAPARLVSSPKTSPS